MADVDVPPSNMFMTTTGKVPLSKRQSMRQTTEEQTLEDIHKSKTPDLEIVFKEFLQCTELLQDQNNIDDFSKMNEALRDRVLERFTDYKEQEQRTVMGNFLARNSFVEALVSSYSYAMEEIDLLNDAVTNEVVLEARERNDAPLLLILTMREIMWNFSDSSYAFSDRLSDTSFLRRLVKDLKFVYKEDWLVMNRADSDCDVFAFDSAVGILHNCARNPNVDKDKFRHAKAVTHLQPFLKSERLYVKMVTLLALGHMLKEDEVHILGTDKEVLDFVMNAISKAEKTEDRMVYGFHLSELVDGLASLAQSDKNKEKIMARDPLPLIKNLLKSHVTTETMAAVKFVWELAFLKANKDKILLDKDLLARLKELKTTSNRELQKAAKSAYFVIAEKDKRVGATVPAGRHVMISYSWGDSDTVYPIVEQIKGNPGFGRQIWIDNENMPDYMHLLDGMAEAVESASHVLLCYSEKYKTSKHCRLEADYAYDLNKAVIPLRVQSGYSADGWLGALISGKIHIDFTIRHSFEEEMRKLVQMINGGRSAPNPALVPVHGLPPQPNNIPAAALARYADGRPYPPGLHSIVPTPPHNVAVKSWQREDIEKWMKDNKMISNAYRRVKTLTGEHLYFIYIVYHRSPETFYRWVESKLNLQGFEEMMRFADAIVDLQSTAI